MADIERKAQWFVTAKKAEFNQIAEKYGIDPVMARIIRNRDVVEDEEIRKYLQGSRKDMYNPRLLKDMDRAAAVLWRKIEDGKKIRIIGDYDADGICSSYILMKGLTACGAEADTVIPHRIKDGYGLNGTLIKEAAEESVDTIVTCDNGIAAGDQIAQAKALGMTVIVTDHHEVPYEENGEGTKKILLPEAEAVIDPKREDCSYPYKNICGAVVAYKLVQQLFASKDMQREELLEELLEITAFATVCDVMELRDENRIIVKYGLKNMKNTRNIGLKALIEVCDLGGKDLSAFHIGFVLGPCLNATGRLDTAKRALMLLQSDNRAEAVEIARELKNLNESRKELTVQGMESAMEMIESSNLSDDKVLVIYLPDIHESLAGIIAGRIREKYKKPAFVLTKGEEDVKGSGRSIETYHMYEEMSLCKEYFTKYGGHRMAAGLSIKEEAVADFRKAINGNCRLTEEDFIEKVHIDAAMPLSYISEKLVRELSILEPFGVGNQKPVFAQKALHIAKGRILGKNKNVGKFWVTDGNSTYYDMMYFGDIETLREFLVEKHGEYMVNKLFDGDKVDIILDITYYPVMNYYNGRESIQIVMQNYR